MSFERMLLEGLVWTLIAASLIEGFPWMFPQKGQSFLNEMMLIREWVRKDSFVKRKSQMPLSREKER